MINTVFGIKIRGGQNFLLTAGGFYHDREYSGADWLVPFLSFDSEVCCPVVNTRWYKYCITFWVKHYES